MPEAGNLAKYLRLMKSCIWRKTKTHKFGADLTDVVSGGPKFHSFHLSIFFFAVIICSF